MRHDRKMIEMGLTLDQKQTKMVTDLAIALALQNVFETERLTKKTMELLTNDEQAYARTLKHAIRHFKGLFSSLVFLHEEGDVQFLMKMSGDLVRAVGTKIITN